MADIKKLLAGMIAVSAVMTSAVSCSGKKSSENAPEELPGEEELDEGKKIDIKELLLK